MREGLLQHLFGQLSGATPALEGGIEETGAGQGHQLRHREFIQRPVAQASGIGDQHLAPDGHDQPRRYRIDHGEWIVGDCIEALGPHLPLAFAAQQAGQMGTDLIGEITGLAALLLMASGEGTTMDPWQLIGAGGGQSDRPRPDLSGDPVLSRGADQRLDRDSPPPRPDSATPSPR